MLHGNTLWLLWWTGTLLWLVLLAKKLLSLIRCTEAPLILIWCTETLLTLFTEKTYNYVSLTSTACSVTLTHLRQRPCIMFASGQEILLIHKTLCAMLAACGRFSLMGTTPKCLSQHLREYQMRRKICRGSSGDTSPVPGLKKFIMDGCA